MLSLLLAIVATAWPWSPAEAASPPPFKVWAPWTAGRTMVVGGPGNFYGQNTHTGADHYAIDINKSGVSDCGEPVRATANGTVKSVTSSTTGYGKHVVVDHGGGYTSRYAHMQSFAAGIVVGKALGHGDLIGYIGTTGNSTGCHLHFAIYLNGSSVPPSPMSGKALTDGASVVSDNSNVPPCSTPTGYFCGEYYDSTTPSGFPQYTRTGRSIEENWGSAAPSSAVGADAFSVAWKGRFRFAGGTHTFTARADDGIRVWVDGELIIDDWTIHPALDYSVPLTLTAGYHVVRVEYFEQSGKAEVSVGWACHTPSGSFCAEYFANTALGGQPVFSRTESAVNGAWGTGGPGYTVPVDGFSVRWRGSFEFAAGRHTFVAKADDGIRISVDGERIVDDWTAHPARSYAVTRDLAEGSHEVVVEYFEGGSTALASLTWRCVPSVRTFCSEYFTGSNLDGSPLYTATASALSQTWSDAGPGNGLPADGFSVRWRGRYSFAGGSHTFSVRADDGVRMIVDGVTVLEDWNAGAARTLRKAVSLTAGWHTVVVEYFDAGGSSSVSLTWQCPAPLGSFCAEYYDGTDLGSAPTFTAAEPFIRSEYGEGGPGRGLGTDEFSVRWRGRFEFAAGEHVFSARADDGIRVSVDGVRIIDDWTPHATRTYSAPVTLTEGTHLVVVEYFERYNVAVVDVAWRCHVPTGAFCGEYHSNKELDGSPAMTRREASISANWRSGSPGGGLPINAFSARWRGRFPFVEGLYHFTARADDGVRILVDGREVLDGWKDQLATTYTAPVEMAKGYHDVTVEYYDRTGSAAAAVWWEMRRPDAHIRFDTDRSYIGNNVYSSNGAGQERTVRVRRGRSATLWVRVGNDGTVADTVRVRGTRDGSGLTIRYYDEAGRSVSSEVKGGTYRLSASPGGVSPRIKVVVTVGSTAEVGSTRPVYLIATSEGPGRPVDAVRAVITATSG